MTSTSLEQTDTSRPIIDYWLETARDTRTTWAIAWLWLGVIALAVAGIFSLMLVISRAPLVGEMFPLIDLFQTSLIIHVDLSILVWFLAFGGSLWCLSSRSLNSIAAAPIFLLAVAGTLVITISPMFGGGAPLMSNYIPILNHPIFFAGLLLFGAGVLLQALVSLNGSFGGEGLASGRGALRFGMLCATITLVLAAVSFTWSWYELPLELVPEAYFELLFWGGGHTLQFTYTMLLMVCWLWLASSGGLALPLSARVVVVILLVGFLPVLVGPVIYLNYYVTDVMHRQMFVWLMSFGGSLGALPLGLAVYIALLGRRAGSVREASAQAALITSMLLFAAGGVIGFLIQGSNVTIPAHYHGSIIGITLALMGVSYDLLPRFGYERIEYRLARLQLWGYAVGQLLHVLGLVWSGGYGVQRKVAGAEQALDTVGRIAGMGLMGIGGLLAAIGGFMFIVLVIRALIGKRHVASAS